MENLMRPLRITGILLHQAFEFIKHASITRILFQRSPEANYDFVQRFLRVLCFAQLVQRGSVLGGRANRLGRRPQHKKQEVGG